jgi:hypothetical protein
MTTEITEVRKGERFVLVQPLTGTFGPADVSIVDVSVGGAKLQHAQPLRIGTAARLTFRKGEIAVAAQGRVIWSHLVQTPNGLVYRSGIQLQPDAAYAAAVNALYKGGMAQRDADSLERKKQRMLEREQERQSKKMRIIPTAGGID